MTIDASVRHVDVVPTVLDALGAGFLAGTGFSGTSLIDLVAGTGSAPRPAYFEVMTANLARGWEPLRGVLVDRDKYIDLPIVETYDLAADPGEQRNLATSDATRTQVLLNTLRTFNTAPIDLVAKGSLCAAMCTPATR